MLEFSLTTIRKIIPTLSKRKMWAKILLSIQSMKKISIILGTRPEAIKLAPVILALHQHPHLKCHVCVTAQHRQMLDQVFQVFDITPDTDLDLMKPGQSLGDLTARAVKALDQYLADEKPDLVLVQGDTTTVFCAALSAFYHHIPIGHVEAGLRTGNLQAPWPEEANRVLTTRLADLHFAPTEESRDNLLREGVNPNRVFVTGNTVVDALFHAVEKIKVSPPVMPELESIFQKADSDQRRIVLITGHRRENFGFGFEAICKAIACLAQKFPNVDFVYPVHLNPQVRKPVNEILRSSAVATNNIHLIEPLSYLPFVTLMEKSYLILTDSGGVQEEAPSLAKPVLVMRETTERPEAVRAGTVKLVGADDQRIVKEVTALLTDAGIYEQMSRAHNPYGDGKSAARIIEICAKFLSQME